MSAAAVAGPPKSIYLVIAHGHEVIRGFNEPDPIAARPVVPADTEIVLFESCGGTLPSIIDCPLIKLFSDGTPAGRALLERPYEFPNPKILKEKLGLPPRLYRPGERHPEINLTPQASWNKGPCDAMGIGDVYAILKSGTYKYPFTARTFPTLGTETARAYYASCGKSIPLPDRECVKYVTFYNSNTYKTTIPMAFEGSVLPTPYEVKPTGGVTYMAPDILLSDFIDVMRYRDPNPSIFYIITCRVIPEAVKKLFEYHKNTIAKIKKASPDRPLLPINKTFREAEQKARELLAKKELANVARAEIKAAAKAARLTAKKKARRARGATGAPDPSPIKNKKSWTISKARSPNASLRREKLIAKLESAARRTRKAKRRLSPIHNTLYEENASAAASSANF